MEIPNLKIFLDELVLKHNTLDFIPNDPISIPHLFSKKQDIEIMGFFASILAWGNRKTIIQKCQQLIQLFDSAPHDFILNHQENDLKTLVDFKHRTFNGGDLISLVQFLQEIYREHNSLEKAFASQANEENVGQALIRFQSKFINSQNFLPRTKKHISSPLQKSACKRLNMFLRWMVRKDDQGVDFGIWNEIQTHQLICPCDVHVLRSAHNLKIIPERKSSNAWNTAVQLTHILKQMDSNDPVKYDFALFGLSLDSKNFPAIN